MRANVSPYGALFFRCGGFLHYNRRRYGVEVTKMYRILCDILEPPAPPVGAPWARRRC